jgi:signal transduction histidine kinase/ActR/RegA family two-component response regulator
MEKQLSPFNFSVAEVIAQEPDSFKRAKIKIALTLLVFSCTKAIIVIPVSLHQHQHLQFIRAILIILLLLSLAKLLLYRPALLNAISHIMIIAGLAIIWSNVFLYVQHINIFTVQMIFMTTLVSYYIIGGTWAAIYTVFTLLPVIIYMITGTTAGNLIDSEELTSVGFDLIVMLNFLTFIVSHFIYYRAFYENLKEKEKLNQQLQVNILEAKALAESRSVFLSTMSHELRTPLNGVIGMTSLLKETALNEQKDNLNILEFSANNLLSVINDILDYNKSELDKIELEAVPVNISALLRKLSVGLEMKAKEKSLIWKLELDEDLANYNVVTDPTRFSQIIYNLAGNALKFTHAGSAGISTSILYQDNERIRIRFSVKDTGIGIPLDRQEAVFDPFTQASSDTTRHYGGTGLGLAIVKRLLMLFESGIQLNSEPGTGSEFSFIITFRLHHGDLNTTEFRKERSGMQGLKLLIVEDNRINIMLLEKLLHNWGIQTVVAVNGEEAVNQILNNVFDGVLMDLHMPVMDGYAATSVIRSSADHDRAHIPIIAMTASVSHNINTKIKEVGMQDYLTKPFLPDQLYEKLQQIYGNLK